MYDDAKSTLSLAYVRDFIEAKTHIPDRQQLLYYGNPPARVVGDANAPIAKLLKLKPNIVHTFYVKKCQSSSYSGPSLSRTSSSGAWDCRTCTFRNDSNATSCAMCNTEHQSTDHRDILDLTMFFVVNDSATKTTTTAMATSHHHQQLESPDEEIPAMQRGVSNESAVSAWSVDGGDDDDGWGDDGDADGGWGDDMEIDGTLSCTTANDDELKQAVAGNDVAARLYMHTDFSILSPSELQERMDDIVIQVSETFRLPLHEAHALLTAVRWRESQLEHALLQENGKALRKKFGIHSTTRFTKDIDMDSVVTCGLCFDDTSITNTSVIGCGHRFCHDCWRGWIQAKFDAGPSSVLPTLCLMHKCTEQVPLSMLRSLASDENKRKLERWLLEKYVSSDADLAWCPAPGCPFAAATTGQYVRGIRCRCRRCYCFSCGLDDHRPVECKDASDWMNRMQNESESINWIMSHTKACPACHVHIEKNQGCNHMTCRNCRHEFCWLCKSDWKKHSSCSTLNPSAANEASRAGKAKTELERYLHFLERFENHVKSQGFAQRALDSPSLANVLAALSVVSSDSSALLASSSSSSSSATAAAAAASASTLADCPTSIAVGGAASKDTQYFVDALETIIMCHRVLKWCNVHVFYWDSSQHYNSDSDLTLFETQFAQLEQFTDRLHELTELSPDVIRDQRKRSVIIHLTRTVQKYAMNVIDQSFMN
jgi:ariadne-1